MKQTTKVSASSPITLCGIFGDDMVLQANKEVKIFGWGGSIGETVEVNFNGQTKKTTVDASGWSVYLDKMGYTEEGLTLSITSDSTSFELKNVNVGEVIFTSGQSNVALEFFKVCDKDLDAIDDYETYDNLEYIRIYNPRWGGSDTETLHEYPYSFWRIPGQLQEDCRLLSAFALGLALRTQAKIGNGVTVGVIEASTGGSCIESWLSGDNLKGNEFHCAEKDRSIYYNNMIYYLKGFTLGGVFYYQGEHCIEFPDEYKNALTLLVNQYRTDFENTSLPVFIVQLPGINADAAYNGAIYRQLWVMMRNVQQSVADMDEDTHLVCISDTGDVSNDPDCIHPADKWLVSDRTSGAYVQAGCAMEKTSMKVEGSYGISSRLISATYEEGVLIIQTNAETLTCKDELIQGFVATFDDDTVSKIEPKIQGNTLRYDSEKLIKTLSYLQVDESCTLNHIYNENQTPIMPIETLSVEEVVKPNQHEPIETKGCGSSIAGAGFLSFLSLGTLILLYKRKDNI